MKYNCILLFCFLYFSCSSQEFCFKYNDKNFCLKKGTKIDLSVGSNSDKSFSSFQANVIIKERESYSSNSNYSSSKSKDIITGEKKGLPAFYANRSVPVKKVIYHKKYNYYQIIIFTPDGDYELFLDDAIKKNEIVSIDGISLKTSMAQKEQTTTNKDSSGSSENDKIIILQSAETEKKSLGFFQNTTDLYGSYGLKRNNPFDTKYGAGFVNHTGYNFKGYIFLGGSVGVSYYKGNDFTSLVNLFAGANQRIYVLPNKKITPEFSLFQRFGTPINSDKRFTGFIQEYGGSVGICLPVKNKFSLSVLAGYCFTLNDKYSTPTEWGDRILSQNAESLFLSIVFSYRNTSKNKK